MEWKGKESAFTSAFSYVNSFKDYVKTALDFFTFVTYTLLSLSCSFLPFAIFFDWCYRCCLLIALTLSRSHYFCRLVCLSFIVTAHKSYRVSVTVATVKRTNSVQEYLTTIFITIQFSLSLLVIVSASLSRCSTFFTSRFFHRLSIFSAHTFIQEFVLLVPDFLNTVPPLFLKLLLLLHLVLLLLLRFLRFQSDVAPSSMQKVASAFYYALFTQHLSWRSLFYGFSVDCPWVYSWMQPETSI